MSDDRIKQEIKFKIISNKYFILEKKLNIQFKYNKIWFYRDKYSKKIDFIEVYINYISKFICFNSSTIYSENNFMSRWPSAVLLSLFCSYEGFDLS